MQINLGIKNIRLFSTLFLRDFFGLIFYDYRNSPYSPAVPYKTHLISFQPIPSARYN